MLGVKNALLLFQLATFTLGDDSTDSSQLTIEGTWSSKSNQVFTGPGFYDPVDELLIEPALPGLSYSFTSDGYFEEATYQVEGNPKNPKCPKASLIFQHGKYEVLTNGTLILNPFEVDGRQVFSDPCNDKGVSTYSRYNQTEIFKSYVVELDEYHGMYKLQLYQFDGSPMQPLYLAYRPPMMLPTETLNPTATDSNVQETSLSKRSLSELVQRGLENKHRTSAKRANSGILNSSIFWYISATMLGLGSVAFLAC